jgi:hypothetical protein
MLTNEQKINLTNRYVRELKVRVGALEAKKQAITDKHADPSNMMKQKAEAHQAVAALVRPAYSFVVRDVSDKTTYIGEKWVTNTKIVVIDSRGKFAFVLVVPELPGAKAARLAYDKDQKRGRELCEKIRHLIECQKPSRVAGFKGYVSTRWSPEDKLATCPETTFKNLFLDYTATFLPVTCSL